ncbi:MAG: histidinol dehydrogenase, partial [Pseudomonadota bacterium]
VRARGFDAVAALTARFDGHEVTADTVCVAPARLREAMEAIDPGLREALQFAADRIRAYHERQVPQDVSYTDQEGVALGWRWTAMAAAGLYAPGGRAAYPSSVLMNAIPAKVAGVARLAMTTPVTGGVWNDAVLAAAHIAGVDEVYAIGGAQAIGALAFGAGPIAAVDVIVGPGNAYVAEAKRQVFGHVGIDSVAGPSEILVVADADNDPDWIAADLLSQAEHDPSSQSILITDSADFAGAVAVAVAAQLDVSPRSAIAGAAWRDNSAIVIVETLADAPALVDRIAPEHLELAVADPAALALAIRNAGAIFLGKHTPEAVGDYVAGPDHVLPTGGGARFASGLSVF